jgi:hypothetical protein
MRYRASSDQQRVLKTRRGGDVAFIGGLLASGIVWAPQKAEATHWAVRLPAAASVPDGNTFAIEQ